MLSVRQLDYLPGEATYSALSNDKNKFHPIEHVDWNGSRYWNGIILKFTAWMIGHTFQFATIAAVYQFTLLQRPRVMRHTPEHVLEFL